MRSHQIRLHGPSGAIEVEMDAESPQDCLDQVQDWMREGAHIELRTRRGTARINMGSVWAGEYIPSGRSIS
jgi:hypothetical protein